ncbi:UvrD-helicase domain-containing protein [Candidatus Fermentibacteria bacterium]|nr:UvrD-helicase domain-containing protein [Candidatus Fermentibacteria bacterium]
MRIVADLHVHGRHSVATSRALSLESLYGWSVRKGIDLVGTGDIVHPAWRGEARELLVPAEDGLFQLDPRRTGAIDIGRVPRRPVRFMLAVEISTIYSDGGRVRKVHHLVLLPSFDAADTLSDALSGIGSISSDGRPILGLSSRNLLETVLECDPKAVLIPAHIWTPWFSALGSKSGYDTIDECYGDLSPHIFAIETGLSSDPAMNWRLSSLDRFAIISNSDAHSAEKLGREATVFECDFSFDGICGTMRGKGGAIESTVEFFPEEGKYHLDGHRACRVRLEPRETRRHGGRCPTCGKPVTVGVMHRVEELADRAGGFRHPKRPGFVRLVPLVEVLGQVLGVGPSTRCVRRAYDHLLGALGCEFSILMDASPDDLERLGGDRLAEAVVNIRAGRVITEAGYDGEYGTVHVLVPEPEAVDAPVVAAQLDLVLTDAPAVRMKEGQRSIIAAPDRSLAVIAGPGSGKTHLLTQRMAQAVTRGDAPVIGITFTRAASRELEARLRSTSSHHDSLWTGTLHQFAHELLCRSGEEPDVLDDRQRAAMLQYALHREGYTVSFYRALRLTQRASALRHGTQRPESSSVSDGMLMETYQRTKENARAMDYDDLIDRAIARAAQPGVTTAAHVFVDEFQDLDAAQYRLVQRMARGPSIMVIGDPYQAIYGFRGGDPRLSERFIRETAHTRVEHLTSSYRCGETILRAADGVARRDPAMTSARGEPAMVEVLRAGSPAKEARMIAGRVREVLGGLTSRDTPSGQTPWAAGFGDIAVLVRTSHMIGLFVKALAEVGIPCRSARATALSEDPAVSRVLAWLRLGLNPESPADVLIARAWRPGDALPAGLGLSERKEVEELALVSTAEALDRLALRGISVGVDADRMRILRRLAEECPRVSSFVTRVMSEREAGVVDGRAEAVRVMTMHAAKGLEFGAVFVTGFREGLLPLCGSDPEEERRLCYVAMTRARSYLALTYAGEVSQISRFAGDIPAEALASPRRPRRSAVQLELDLW